MLSTASVLPPEELVVTGVVLEESLYLNPVGTLVEESKLYQYDERKGSLA